MPRLLILGHERALEILDNALRSGRFHHAWIFSGPRGVGKFTAAIEVARVLLDPQEHSVLQMGRGGEGEIGRGLRSTDIVVSPSPPLPISLSARIQHLIDTNTHPDLHIIRKELALYSDNRELREKKLRNIPIDLLRERVIGGRSGEATHEAAAYRTAALGHGKVFIIDEAELLDRAGQDAMLKTLEEPPAQTYFFLITSNPDRLSATIRSRCQIVHFGRLSRREMEQWWKEREGEKGRQGDGEAEATRRVGSPSPPLPLSPSRTALEWAFDFADGSPGTALLALEFGFHEWQKSLDPMLRELDQGRFPAAMGERLGAMVEEFAQAWVKRHGKEHTSKDAANKDGARHVLTLLSAHARKRLTESVGDDEAAERWGGVIESLRECERQTEFNVNQKLALENLVAQWNLALNGERV